MRAWLKIQSAERFSKQTGRTIILRLKLPNGTPKLEGHRGEAIISSEPYFTNQIFNKNIGKARRGEVNV